MLKGHSIVTTTSVSGAGSARLDLGSAERLYIIEYEREKGKPRAREITAI